LLAEGEVEDGLGRGACWPTGGGAAPGSPYVSFGVLYPRDRYVYIGRKTLYPTSTSDTVLIDVASSTSTNRPN
jgi:hypothetical protein